MHAQGSLSPLWTLLTRDIDAYLIAGAGAGAHEKSHASAKVLPWRTVQGGALECLVAGTARSSVYPPFKL